MSKSKNQQQYRGGICAQEDFCKGCGNFDAFFNSCKLAEYDTSIQGKKERIHPVTNHSRWLLAIVGCASDTRNNQMREEGAKAERERVLDEVRDRCAEKMSERNPSITGVMLYYILSDLRSPSQKHPPS